MNHHIKGTLTSTPYGDDIALAEDIQELEKNAQLWQRSLADSGLRLNVKKTEIINSEQNTGSTLELPRGEYREGKKIPLPQK